MTRRRRLLFLSRWYPWPTDNGSRLRIYHVLQGLAAEFDVTLISFGEPWQSAEPSPLTALCREVVLIPYRAARRRSLTYRLGLFHPTPRDLLDNYAQPMAAAITERVANHDVVVASQFDFLPYAPLWRGKPALLEELELGMRYGQWRQAKSWRRRIRYGLTWLKTVHYVRRQLRDVDAVTVVSEHEQTLLKRVAPRGPRVLIVPNGIEPDAYVDVAPEVRPNSLVYAGAVTFHANYVAVASFLREIWPQIRAAVPEARLLVTGRHDGVTLPAGAADPAVTFTGYLTDIRPTVAGAAISIVPLRHGGGTRLKILESMALGTPVVATSKGAEGLAARPDEHLLIADTPDAFAAAVIHLLQAPEERQALADRARRFVSSRYAWSTILPPLVRTVAGLVPE